MRQLDEIELSQLKRLRAGENISSSDRPTDKARQRLKRLGLIAFDRSSQVSGWRLTDAGRKMRSELRE
jgi:hypothetical protein